MLVFHQVPLVKPSSIALKEVETLLATERSSKLLVPTLEAASTWGKDATSIVPLITPHLYSDQLEVRLHSARALALIYPHSPSAGLPLYLAAHRTDRLEREEFRQRVKYQIPQEAMRSFNSHFFHIEGDVPGHHIATIMDLAEKRNVHLHPWPLRQIAMGIGRNQKTTILEDCVSALSNIAPHLDDIDLPFIRAFLMGEIYAPFYHPTERLRDFVKIMDSLPGSFDNTESRLSELSIYRDYLKTKSLPSFPIFS